jgi:hypothetical protein
MDHKATPQTSLPGSDLYIIYSMSNSPYQQWQANLLDFSAHEVGQRGVIVRLCSLDNDFPDLEVSRSQWGYTFVTPSFVELGDASFKRFIRWAKRRLRQRALGRFHFYCLNKAYSMREFLASHPHLESEAKLLWLDPDMIFHRSWEPPESMVRRGHACGQYWWGYSQKWCRKSAGKENETFCVQNESAVMFPFCILVADMRRIVDSFCDFSQDVYRRTQDWKSEMCALVMAMSEAKLECHTIDALGTCNNWPRDIPNNSSAPISHYTQAMMDRNGREIWNKRTYTAETSVRPWNRPPHPSEAQTLTDQWTLQMLHRFIDWQESRKGR